MLRSFVLFAAVAAGSALAAGQAPDYSEYILTPRSRTLVPAQVYKVNGTVKNAAALAGTGGVSGVATFTGPSAVTYDFGKNVAGIVSFTTGAVDGPGEAIGFGFSESSLYISSEGSDATELVGIDELLWFPVSAGTFIAADKAHERGGFRYLSLYHNTSGSTDVTNLTVHFTAIPQVADDELGKYTGYFHCDDDKVNRVWYAGAYTCELCTIDPTAGNALPLLGTSFPPGQRAPLPWYVNYTITDGTSALVDGAKRDRLVWPGDMSIALPTIAVSTYYMDAVANSLTSLVTLQNASGALPYAGVPFYAMQGYLFSFTYHCYSLIAIYDHYLWTGDVDFLTANWAPFVRGLNFALTFVDSTGLADVSGSWADWLRNYMGGHNIEANAILYYTLTLGLELAALRNDSSQVASWTSHAATIKSVANTRLWDASANLYRDNDSLPLTSLHPQDGNAWAVLANLTLSPAQATQVSSALMARWGPFGPPAPEAGATVSPFISGFELQAHYVAGHGAAAVQLVRSMWADFLLDDARMTNSTLMEGYSTDGSLHYAPYADDARVSFAHGWASGPTSVLTMRAAGLQVRAAGGRLWRVAPDLAGLAGAVRAGFATRVGRFACAAAAAPDGSGYAFNFTTPPGTTGSVGVVRAAAARHVTICGGGLAAPRTEVVPAGGPGERFVLDGLSGGDYQVVVVDGGGVPSCDGRIVVANR